MIIGQDLCRLMLCREVFEFEQKEFVLSKCKLGWSIHGKIVVERSKQVEKFVNFFEKNEEADYLKFDKLINEYFELESLGIINKAYINEDDRRAVEILDKTSRKIGNKWEVGLLWRSDKVYIPDSKRVALYRLKLFE